MSLPSRNHLISLSAAADETRRHRESAPDVERGGAFHAGQVRELLAQPECEALRCYYGMEESGARNLVLVGVAAGGSEMSDGIILELRYPCPPFCGDGSLLNGRRLPFGGRRPYRAVPLLLPRRDHRISAAEAAEYIGRYTAQAAGAEWGGTFHAGAVREVLAHRDCTALRYYHGRDEAGRAQLILLGVDRDGADMTEGTILGNAFPSAPFAAVAEMLAEAGR